MTLTTFYSIQPVIDNRTITLGETGGIVSLDLSKSAIPLVTSAGLGGAISDYQLGLTLGEIDGMVQVLLT
jgi:hypothetical protein